MLETERLTLRAHGVEDFEECAAVWADPAVTRFIGGKPSTAEESWARVLRYIGHWAAMGYGFWALREKATGRFVGEVGFADFKRAIDPLFDGTPEMGWVLASEVHGKGYGTEAVRGALGWLDGRAGGAARAVCMIDPGNAASLGVARKNGFVEYARTLYKGEPTVLLRR